MKKVERPEINSWICDQVTFDDTVRFIKERTVVENKKALSDYVKSR